MLCNVTSHYPDGIDQMLFFQDNDLDNMDIINTYDQLITQGNYTEADRYINQQDGVYGYFADFFNAMENRIHNLQDHLLEKPPIKKQFAYFDADESAAGNEPAIEEGMFWI